ncbi:ER degradation-enhancing alpha-mannosidase-like protein 3 [Oopsacas minuta]|uniref:alpha-1,2-Mannosidase n=1 Tax=Oopsacas minuta TaxID=111878 RepID=A0AAV7JUQ7_9METZ|nr:ER degradation-enhancing alpha-mannosidase-like protein 3 [Oopsacas minuta]
MHLPYLMVLILLILLHPVSSSDTGSRLHHKADLPHINKIVNDLSSLNTSHTDVTLTSSYKEDLRDRVQALFNHTYTAYMLHAYPYDELMPLSCSGRNRGVTPSRGDVDEALGNFSLTLIDTLDTLALMGQIQEFSYAIRRVIRQVTFNANLSVSVFETNIRVLGGLLSGHVLAEHLKARGHGEVAWYRGELLEMSTEVAHRLIPAFYSETGIPYPLINLKTGRVVGTDGRGTVTRSTCTACAGTLLLEFGALSRLTGNPLWERKAKEVLHSIWLRRDAKTHLVGSVIDVENGKWLRTDSGVGAGLDSYFEYLLKGYILFGDRDYWDMFNEHYISIEKYVRRGMHMVQVSMDNPSRPIRSYADSLAAFWPGLQVLAGDVWGARRVYQGFLQVVDKWEVLPEAYNFDLGVHWGQHHLRPEFIESTLFLYQATRSSMYLEIGRKTLEVLEKYAKVECGLAAFEDVKSKKLADRMDSFVLAETLKYLYLLFSEEGDLPINIDEFIFTTEAHLLPLSLSTKEGSSKGLGLTEEKCLDELRSLELYRNLIRDLPVTMDEKPQDLCTDKAGSPQLSAHELDLASESHRQLLTQMGISIQQQQNGNLQLVYNPAGAHSQQLSAAGTQLMQELIKLAETARDGNGVLINSNVNFRSVVFNEGTDTEIVSLAGAAMFGRALAVGSFVGGPLAVYSPLKGCDVTAVDLSGRIALIERGGCLFQEKAINAQNAGAIGAIIYDDSKENNSKLITMSADPEISKDSLIIPAVYIGSKEGRLVKNMIEEGHEVTAKILGEALLDKLDKKQDP